MRWLCGCGSVAEERLEFCPTCLHFGSYSPMVSRPVHVRPGKIPRATCAELRRRAARNVVPGEAWGDVLPAGVQSPFMLVIFGQPGTGKTSLAMRLADDWPGRAVMLPFEEGIGATIAAKAVRLELCRLAFALPDTWDEILEVVEPYDLVLADSLQRSAIDPGEWRGLCIDRGKSLILVSEVNAAGEVRGGLAASHLGDVVIELPSFGEYRVRKNRFGDLTGGRIEGCAASFAPVQK